MLLLMCRDAAGRYALPTSAVIEVIPCIEIDFQLSRRGEHLGVCNFRGRTLPVLDLTRARTGQAFSRRWNTRIVVICCGAGDSSQLVGLVAERVKAIEMEDQVVQRADGSAAGRFGPILLDERGMFELIRLDRLLSEFFSSENVEASAP